MLPVRTVTRTGLDASYMSMRIKSSQSMTARLSEFLGLLLYCKGVEVDIASLPKNKTSILNIPTSAWAIAPTFWGALSFVWVV